MQHLEISRAWGGPHPTLLVTDFQWLGTADVVAGTPREEQNQSPGASPSGRAALSCTSPPCPLRRCTYHFTRIFCSTQSGLPSLIFAPSLESPVAIAAGMRSVAARSWFGCIALLENSQEITPSPYGVSSTWFCLSCSAGSSKGLVTMMGSLLDVFF